MCYVSEGVKQGVTRLKRNDLEYRARINRLSFKARAVLSMFESGASADDIISLLSQDYRCGSSWFITKEERRAGQIEFVRILGEIRSIIDE